MIQPFLTNIHTFLLDVSTLVHAYIQVCTYKLFYWLYLRWYMHSLAIVRIHLPGYINIPYTLECVQ